MCSCTPLPGLRHPETDYMTQKQPLTFPFRNILTAGPFVAQKEPQLVPSIDIPCNLFPCIIRKWFSFTTHHAHVCSVHCCYAGYAPGSQHDCHVCSIQRTLSTSITYTLHMLPILHFIPRVTTRAYPARSSNLPVRLSPHACASLNVKITRTHSHFESEQPTTSYQL